MKTFKYAVQEILLVFIGISTMIKYLFLFLIVMS